jgi:hypothetical protein
MREIRSVSSWMIEIMGTKRGERKRRKRRKWPKIGRGRDIQRI